MIKFILGMIFGKKSKKTEPLKKAIDTSDASSRLGSFVVSGLKLEQEILKSDDFRKYFDAKDVITSSGRYKERLTHYRENKPSLQGNVAQITDKVNAILNDIGYEGKISITSGLRTPKSNAKAGGARKSAHMKGMAVDLLDDKKQSLYHAIYGDGSGELLRKYGLFMEKGEYTRGKRTNWVHLDFKERKDREDRTFIP